MRCQRVGTPDAVRASVALKCERYSRAHTPAHTCTASVGGSVEDACTGDSKIAIDVADEELEQDDGIWETANANTEHKMAAAHESAYVRAFHLCCAEVSLDFTGAQCDRFET
ncbi:hypothetical protein EVAR_96500_1 [Eumeta japonica]|uniref:Uncharacterized protein n=1 Tax=Eumeta variegata TaxID=151549 RepID=A0A4C1ZTI5_EUMVA|nr:hypothetical protein EVAR_96500_1 [Eumeta japonica]